MIRKFFIIVLTLLLSSIYSQEQEIVLSELNTLINLEKDYKDKKAAYETCEFFKYISLGGFIGGVGLGSATLTMDSLNLFNDETQRKSLTISSAVILGVSLIIGVASHISSNEAYSNYMTSYHDYYTYMEENTNYLKGEIK